MKECTIKNLINLLQEIQLTVAEDGINGWLKREIDMKINQAVLLYENTSDNKEIVPRR